MAEMAALVERLEAVASRLEKVSVSGGGGGGSGADDGASSASIEGWDEIVDGTLKTFLDKSTALGAEVAEMVPLLSAAFAAQRAFLVMVGKSQKPSPNELGPLLKDTSEAMAAVTSFKEKNFKSKQGNHLSGMADFVGVLGWVTFDKPCPFIKETGGAAQFYTNRVIKEFKDSDPEQVAWARLVATLTNELHDYVKKHHTTGPCWNPNGVKAAAPDAAPAPKPAAAPQPKKAPAGDVRGGLFAALNKGGDVTSGLKKVEKSQMTHKNPELRGSSVVPAQVKKAPTAVKKFNAAPAAKKDPVCELTGKKWAVEYQDGNKNVCIETEGSNQTLYVFKCVNSTIQVKGKINAITLDGCKKTAIVFDTCVASFELINCQSVQVQVQEKVKTISIDKTDGCQIYLSKDSLDAEIISAKSSEMNVSLPVGDDDEFVEMPMPEQYKTVYDPATKKLVTECTDIAG